MAAFVFDDSDYRSSHGAAPRGRGSWGFCPTDPRRDLDYLSKVLWFHGTYGEAKRQARVAGRARGLSGLYVCA